MPLKTLVKVGALINLSDARYCAGMGVELIGFRVIPGHQSYVEPGKFQEIRGWVSGPHIVAEIYGLSSPDQLGGILENYKPDYLELGTAELSIIQHSRLPYILSIDEQELTPVFTRRPSFLLVKHMPKTADGIAVLKAVESVRDAEEAMGEARVKGIAVTVIPEIKPGLKSYDFLASILEQLEDE